MKKYIIILTVLCFIISGYSTIASKQSEKNYQKEVLIHQISPNNNNKIITSYAIKTNNQDSDKIPQLNPTVFEGYDYIIITTNDLVSSIISSKFTTWKESIGYKIKIVKTTDDLIQDQNGLDIQAKIRNFLREY